MDWLLYDRGLRHERVQDAVSKFLTLPVSSIFNYVFKNTVTLKKGNVKDSLHRLLFTSVLYKESEIQVFFCKFCKTLNKLSLMNTSKIALQFPMNRGKGF